MVAWYWRWLNILETDENTLLFCHRCNLIRDYALFERLFLSPEQKQPPFPTLGVQIQDLKDSQKENFCKNVGYGEGWEIHKH